MGSNSYQNEVHHNSSNQGHEVHKEVILKSSRRNNKIPSANSKILERYSVT